MENQGKRLLLAVGLALIVMLGWQMVFPQKKEPPKPVPTAGSGSQVVPVDPGAASMPTPGVPGVVAAPEVPCTPEAPIALSFPGKFDATFSNCGGSLTSWRLADPKLHKDPDAIPVDGEMLHKSNGAFFVDFTRSSSPKYWIPRNASWTGTKVSANEVRFTFSNENLDVEKTYTVSPDAYLVKLTIKVVVKTAAEGQQRLAVSSFQFQDPTADMEGSSQVEARVWQSSTMRGDAIFHTSILGLEKAPRHETNITWTGFEHPYMLNGYAPRRTSGEIFEKYSVAVQPRGMMRTDILFPPASLKTGEPLLRELVAYIGPKNYKSLQAADAAAGFATGFTETIDFGWFGVIGRPLLWLLQKFHDVFGNWGIAIMLLTFLVKLATIYWTTKSMRSMKAMAALAPQMKGLQEKYKDDRQRLQAETMALYKQHSVNPIAGCLPILLQMPIWIALYRMLSSAGELYQAPFIPGWIDDLTKADPVYVLPVVLMVTMFVQARLTPSTGNSGQQKMLQYGMPLMFGVMSFFFPAGLTLYIFTNTVLSALHSIWMNKFDKKSLALAATMKANAEAAAAKAAAAAAPKSGKSGTKPGARAGKPVKPVIDVESTEADDDGDGDDDDNDDSAATSGTSTGQARQRPKRKKRRR